jgi:hypothetical protein
MTGRVEGARNSTSSITIGIYSGTVSSSGHITIDTTPTTFTNEHVTLLLRHANDSCSEVQTLNMSPTLRTGDLVSVAQLQHGRRAGYVFMVFNHSTGLTYQESLRSGQFVTKGGIAKMIMRLPVAHQVVLFLLIVTIPLILLLGIGAQLQIRQFRNHGSKRLINLLRSRGQLPPVASPAPVPTGAVPSPPPPPALRSEPPPPATPASWLPDPTGRHQLRYWDGAHWTEHVSDGGATTNDPVNAPSA